MSYKNFNIIRVSLPKEGHDNKNLVQDVIALLQRSSPVGVMGNYSAVYEMTDNLEGFTPLKGANPTKGSEGGDEQCTAYLFTTYSHTDVPTPILEKFLKELTDIHPWEHPVIEIYSAMLWVN